MERVLVVGTTPDYVDLILKGHPGRALFLTDPRFREGAREDPPAAIDEVLEDLTRPPAVILQTLQAHLDRWGLALSGITSFDCESLLIAARLAESFGLPYPRPGSMLAARDKFACKRLWLEAGLPCPRARLVREAREAAAFLRQLPAAAGGPAPGIVLKPLTGSGSELVFLCRTAAEIERAVEEMRARLAGHRDVRMYAPIETPLGRLDPRAVFVAEEFVAGDEHSCDFLIDGDRVEVVRVARKLLAPAGWPLGTTLAYELPARLPPAVDPDAFRRQLGEAAWALGITRAICMLDFIVRGDRALMIEMSPRPGGDCLPPLILASSGLDMLRAALDLAEGREIEIPPAEAWRRRIGLRLFAREAGTVARIDPARLAGDPRVCAVHLTREPGHRVVLPPDNYDSRILGYAIFAPSDRRPLADECAELAGLLDLELRRAAPVGPTGAAGGRLP